MPAGASPTVELVQRAQQGDRAAFDQLCARYARRVRRFVRVHLPHELRRHADSEDVMQDVFLNAVRAFHRFEMRDDDSLLHWLATIAANRIRDLASSAAATRRDGAHPPLGSESTTRVLDPVSPSDGPSGAAAREEEAALVEQTLHEMETAQRDLILMRNHLEMSWDAIGAALGVSADAARMRHAGARIALAKALRQRGIAGDPS